MSSRSMMPGSERGRGNLRFTFEGITLLELKRLREIEGENVRLTRMYADLSLEHEAPRDLFARKL